MILTITGQVVSAHFLESVIRTRMNVGGNVISFDMFNSPASPRRRPAKR
ncbi:UNVERIFIED_ORG: hypothetical protein GGI57_004118 [Rhizobium aethiopicum]